MADEKLDPTTPAEPATPASEEPVEAPAASPDPSPGDTPTTSPEASEPSAGDLESKFTKDELVAAAAVQGVDVPSSATKADIAEAIVAHRPAFHPPVVVDNKTVRSDDDVILGGWADVVAGEHQGRFGAYFATERYDSRTGYPSVVHVRSRDANNEILTVNYSDIRPSERTGGR